jgi:hypothetical protein
MWGGADILGVDRWTFRLLLRISAYSIEHTHILCTNTKMGGALFAYLIHLVLLFPRITSSGNIVTLLISLKGIAEIMVTCFMLQRSPVQTFAMKMVTHDVNLGYLSATFNTHDILLMRGRWCHKLPHRNLILYYRTNADITKQNTQRDTGWASEFRNRKYLL